MVDPPPKSPMGRWSGPLAVIVLLAAGIVFWIVMAQLQRDALARIKADLVEFEQRVDELTRENERLRARVEALTEALDGADSQE